MMLMGRSAALLLLLLLPLAAAAADADGQPAAADNAAAATSGDAAVSAPDNSDTSDTATAAGGLSVDARFDKTGDGIVDASDWAQMDEATKLEYARESVAALGEDPDALLEGRLTRAQRYLEGLRAVYE